MAVTASAAFLSALFSNFGSLTLSIYRFFFSISLLSSFPYNFLLHMAKVNITTRQWLPRLRFLCSLIFREFGIFFFQSLNYSLPLLVRDKGDILMISCNSNKFTILLVSHPHDIMYLNVLSTGLLDSDSPSSLSHQS